MDQRKYNVYFHTHTISGITIAAILYVIFFAGSFSFFKDDISAWQKGKSNVAQSSPPDYNYVLDSLSQKHNLLGRNIDFYVLKQGNGAYVSMTASQDSTVSKPKPVAAKGKRGRRGAPDGDTADFLYFFGDKKASSYTENYDMGEFLYRLHFLAQLNQVPIRLGAPFGYLLAAIVSFLFLFALLTGLMLHWDKIKSNFFLFRPWSKWKTVWTDMHTVLGVIGFPFQLVYAITGIVLIVNIALTTPFTKLLFNGNDAEFYEALQYSKKIAPAYTYKTQAHKLDLNAFVQGWQKKWNTGHISQLQIRNYDDKSMQLYLEAKPNPTTHFAGSGFVHLDVTTGKILDYKSPNTDATYIDGVKGLIYHLHFGDFGGKPVRIIFFLLGLVGCVVIISGIMIWLVARDKKNIPEYKRKFNFWACNVFLSICLSMLPVTAVTFIAVKFMPAVNQSVIYSVYFYSWLVLSIYLLIWRDLAIVNRQTLFLSAMLCLAVPIANGMATGMWMWRTVAAGAFDIFFVDALFVVLGVACAYALLKVHKQAKPFKVLK